MIQLHGFRFIHWNEIQKKIYNQSRKFAQIPIKFSKSGHTYRGKCIALLRNKQCSHDSLELEHSYMFLFNEEIAEMKHERMRLSHEQVSNTRIRTYLFSMSPPPCIY